MNKEIEFHDSKVGLIDVGNGIVTVKLTPAYVHQSSGRPGIDPGSGWLQEAWLRFSAGEILGQLPIFPRDVSDGSLEQPTPEKSQLQLEFNSGEKIVVVGSAVEIKFIGEARYVEEFPRGSANR
jgi:hypothetical protein